MVGKKTGDIRSRHNKELLYIAIKIKIGEMFQMTDTVVGFMHFLRLECSEK